MNVVIDNGSYRMDNMGDVAMLQVLVHRLQERWPNADVGVLNDTPDRLERACPGTHSIEPSAWHTLAVIPKLSPLRDASFGGSLRRFERHAARFVPKLTYRGKRRHRRHQPEVAGRLDRYYEAVRDADLVVASGGGYVNDHHADHAMKVLHTLALAQGLGIATGMVGAGLGPMTDAAAIDLARPVLRRLDLLALREGDGNREELVKWGVPPDKAIDTGDDAIEPARARWNDTPGDAIGICLRVAEHSNLSHVRAAEMAEAIWRVTATSGVPLRGLPVRSRLSPKNDVDTLRRAFGDKIDLAAAEAVTLPADLLDLVAGCRVVVTGAYHAAVFALSMGIGVVALTNDPYYDRKFGGLIAQFGGQAIRILPVAEADFDALAAAIDSVWTLDPETRRSLKTSAEAQVAAGRQAYGQLFDLVDAKKGKA